MFRNIINYQTLALASGEYTNIDDFNFFQDQNQIIYLDGFDNSIKYFDISSNSLNKSINLSQYNIQLEFLIKKFVFQYIILFKHQV
jgi:hypothetical protein